LGYDVLLRSGDYLRTSAVEYLGGYQTSQGRGEKFVVAFVEAPGQNRPRQVRWIVVDALHCTWGDMGRLTEELETVQWLNAGGYVPAGYQWFDAYPRQGWLAASTRGSATEMPEVKLYRFVSEADRGHGDQPQGAHGGVYPKDRERTDRAFHVECEPAVGGRFWDETRKHWAIGICRCKPGGGLGLWRRVSEEGGLRAVGMRAGRWGGLWELCGRHGGLPGGQVRGCLCGQGVRAGGGA